uniref:Alkyl hydroperoxide reductase n=1 Tax=uncultured bacterium N27-1E TaxID=1497526 RepID=A0A059U0G3_9BACT|nr:alkyl hydroperoxide reductase [uncultured bacterium N27-1E]
MSGAMLSIIALLLVAGSMALWFRRIHKVEIPEDRRGYVAFWVGGAALGVIALIQGAGWIGAIPAAIAVFAGSFFSVSVLVSPQKATDDAIRVGESLRDFTALDENGDEFSLSGFAGKPVLIKFFRGHW